MVNNRAYLSDSVLSTVDNMQTSSAVMAVPLQAGKIPTIKNMCTETRTAQIEIKISPMTCWRACSRWKCQFAQEMEIYKFWVTSIKKQFKGNQSVAHNEWLFAVVHFRVPFLGRTSHAGRTLFQVIRLQCATTSPLSFSAETFSTGTTLGSLGNCCSNTEVDVPRFLQQYLAFLTTPNSVHTFAFQKCTKGSNVVLIQWNRQVHKDLNSRALYSVNSVNDMLSKNN